MVRQNDFLSEADGYKSLLSVYVLEAAVGERLGWSGNHGTVEIVPLKTREPWREQAVLLLVDIAAHNLTLLVSQTHISSGQGRWSV